MIRRVRAYWFEPLPATRLAMLRVLVGSFALVYLCIRSVHFWRMATFSPAQFSPIGVVSLFSEPLPALLMHALLPLSIGLGICFVLGLGFRVTGPAFALLFLWQTTYRSSYGMVFHTENLLTLHLGVLALSPAADALVFKRADRTNESHERYGWPIRLVGWVTALTYLVAGIAKLRNAGLEWAMGDVLRMQIAYDNLRKAALGDLYSPLGVFLVAFPFVFPPLALMSLGVELFAPLFMLRERWSRWWAGLAFSFHLGVLALMFINFPYQVFGVAYASYFPLDRWSFTEHVRGWMKSATAPTGADPDHPR